jgi:hypothetical protein
LERGDALAARSEKQNLDQRLDAISLAVGGGLGLLQGVRNTMGDGQDSSQAAENDAVRPPLKHSTKTGGAFQIEDGQGFDQEIENSARSKGSRAAGHAAY